MSFHFSYRFRISPGIRANRLSKSSVFEDLPHTLFRLYYIRYMIRSGKIARCIFRHQKGGLAARGGTLQGRVTSAIGPYARRHDDVDALHRSRSGNAADGPMPS